MKFTIAMQPDDYGPGDSASRLWTRILENAGHSVRTVNIYNADILRQLQGCNGFMWRYAHLPNLLQIARRLLPVVEREMDMVVYPDQRTCWHYDDKIAQSYLLQAEGIATPKTWIWFDKELSRQWAKAANYPIVLKLWSGAGSTNVQLVNSFKEAGLWIDRLFGKGLYRLNGAHCDRLPWGRTRLKTAARVLLKGTYPELNPNDDFWQLHKNYVLFQEYLPGNAFDTRITVIGNRAFGFRRFNREKDFRASGSGKIDWDPAAIDEGFIRLAFHTARAIGSQSCAIDGLFRGNELVVGEISYTYASWAVQACPGHWELNGAPNSGELSWKEGRMWPEEAQVEDFLKRLEARERKADKVCPEI